MAGHILAFKASDPKRYTALNWPKQVPWPSPTLIEGSMLTIVGKYNLCHREEQCIFAKNDTVYHEERAQSLFSCASAVSPTSLAAPICCSTITCMCVCPFSSVMSSTGQGSCLRHHPSLAHRPVPGNYYLLEIKGVSGLN